MATLRLDNMIFPSREDVCDDCINVAYDNGIEGYEHQADMMRIVGADAEDHECIKYIEPGEKCGCPC